MGIVVFYSVLLLMIVSSIMRFGEAFLWGVLAFGDHQWWVVADNPGRAKAAEKGEYKQYCNVINAEGDKGEFTFQYSVLPINQIKIIQLNR